MISSLADSHGKELRNKDPKGIESNFLVDTGLNMID